jgi:broad specificity phosphatase PhoE
VSRIYLVRHGQAGTRDNYDALSELGRQQSHLLGEYFVSQNIIFTSAISGPNTRQQQTAEEVRAAYKSANLNFPELTIDEGWKEFDLDHIYRELAPRLSADDPQFQKDFEAMRDQVRANRGVPDAEIHRRWMPTDGKVVQAWIHNRHPYTGESWKAFRGRIAARRVPIQDGREPANIAIFTSATPTAIWVGLALNLDEPHIFSLAGVLQNSAFSVLRLRGEVLRLFSFNEVPHLPSLKMRSHR